MAINEKAEVTITLNGAAAEAQISRLESQAEKYRAKIKEANAAGADSSKFVTQLKNVEKQLKGVRTEAGSYKTVLDNLSGSTMRELQKAYRQLRTEVSKLNPQTQAYIDKSAQLKLVKERMNQLNTTVKNQTTLWERATDRYNKYFSIIATAAATITGMSLALKKASQAAAQMDDTYSDVMKTTGLTRDEVVELNKEFAKIDTRTSREALNYLARDAGKLGIAKDQLLGFVNAADKINVALGEDLGEGAIINIGKISDVFGKTKEMGVEKSYISIGSAINALGQDSSASEKYLVDFTQRMAGASAQASISVQDILGYASALDQSGMKVEMAATAFQTFILKMYSDTATFAKYANMDLLDFSQLLEKDANSAILKVLTTLNQAGGLKELSPMFAEMGTNGAKAVSVLASVATNIDAVTKAQELSNKEFAKASSLQSEFETKNNNMMAQLEKARKVFNDKLIALGESLSPLFLQTTKLSTIAIKVLAEHGKEIVVATTTLVALTTAYRLYAAKVAIANTLTATGTIVTKGAAAAQALLTGNITRASAAWRVMSKSFAASPLGLIATGVVAIGTGLAFFINKVRAAGQAMRDFYAESGKLKLEADSLLGVLEKNAAGTDLYKNALAKLKELYGPYIQDLITEKGELKDIALAREEINKAIEVSIANKITEEKISSITEKRLKSMANNYETLVKKLQTQAGISEEAARMYADNLTKMVKEGESSAKIYQAMVALVGEGAAGGSAWANLTLFGQKYRGMLSDIEDANKQFNFVKLPSADSWVGPILKTEEEIAEERQKLAELSAEEKKALYDKELQTLEAKEAAELLTLKKNYLARQISQEEYQKTAEALNITFLARKNALAIAYAQDNTDIDDAYTDALIKQQENLDKLIEQIGKVIESSIDDSIGEIDTDINLKVKLEESSVDDFLADWNKLLDSAAEVKKNVNKASAAEEYKSSLENLAKLYSQKLITEQEYDTAVGEAKLERATYIAEQISNIASLASDVITGIQDIELQELDVQKEKELALYGTTADARAEIEAKYEEQKLEVQKKYANIEMGMQIGQALASGAVSVLKTFEQYGFTPWGIAAAALMSAVTTAEVATIVAQRNALMSSSYYDTSSSSTTIRSVNGYSSGGYTPNSSSDDDPVGVVHANEWVAPAYMVRSNPTIFRLLENMRTKGSSNTAGYKDGGYTSSTTTVSSGNNADNAALIAAINLLVAKLGIPIKAYVVYQDIADTAATIDKFNQIASR